MPVRAPAVDEMEQADTSGETAVQFDGENTVAAQGPLAQERFHLCPCLLPAEQVAAQPLTHRGIGVHCGISVPVGGAEAAQDKPIRDQRGNVH
jgi:hypothetical protein